LSYVFRSYLSLSTLEICSLNSLRLVSFYDLSNPKLNYPSFLALSTANNA